ncbi:MAG TPA: hypothetical protein VMC62_03605 [Longilinea sp.]|nr:hypothetical protein [Longilinea sp.]
MTDLLLMVWMLCWIIGGWWMVHATFRLRPEEEGILGLVVGLAAEVGLANFVARVVTLPWAIWISAIVVLLVGMALAVRQGGFSELKIKVVPGQWVALIVMIYIFFLLDRGMAIYDDYAHLPTLSLMATGQIPPHFAYDPQIPYGYHYFLLLFGAQIMRLGSWQPWTAWDIARAFSIAPAVILGGMWAYRVTHNQIARVLGGAAVLFISGTRWLLLFLPNTILSVLSSQVQLSGAGTAAGSTLLGSLASPWPVEGQGSFPFPYAFQNGVFTSGAEAVHNSIGLMLVAVLFALLLTSTRWRNALGGLISIVLISSIGLLDETELPLMTVALAILTAGWMIQERSVKLPKPLKMWWVVWVISGVIVAVQGGVWTDTLSRLLNQFLGHPVLDSYFTTEFQLAAPAIVSNQLGVLSLLNAGQLLVALTEIGPIVLVLPLLVFWGWKAARAGRWYEATLSLAAIMSLVMIFVRFTGSTGVRNGSRLYFFVPVCSVMAVSLVWLWISHRTKVAKWVVVSLAGMVMFGGLVMLGAQLPSMKNQVFSYFITLTDARVEADYWNRLEPDVLVFDPTPSRSVTIFGRYTDAGSSWYTTKATFTDLVAMPDVYKMRAAGFSYAYLDQNYWGKLTPDEQAAFTQPCAVLVHTETQYGDWRKLYDIRGCQ